MRAVLAALMITATVGCAANPPVVGAPVVTVVPAAHPNLAAAQELVAQAFNRLEAAQQANHRQLGGHAESAKALLIEASSEIELAAETANNR